VKIVRVDIVDSDVSLEDRLQDTFYLVEPNEDRLKELKDMVEQRFNRAENNEPAIEQYTEVIDFIYANFATIDIETIEIGW